MTVTRMDSEEAAAQRLSRQAALLAHIDRNIGTQEALDRQGDDGREREASVISPFGCIYMYYDDLGHLPMSQRVTVASAC
jgi:hypothetical protein